MTFAIYKSNCVYDNVLYAFSSELEEVKENLNQGLLKWSEWFYEDCLILNPNKCHYMCLGRDIVIDLLQFFGEDLKDNKPETVIGIDIDNKLNSEGNINSL